MCSVLNLPKYASVLVLTSIFHWYIHNPVNNLPLMCFVHIYIYCTFIIFRINLSLAVLIAKKEPNLLFLSNYVTMSMMDIFYMLHSLTLLMWGQYLGALNGGSHMGKTVK